MRDHLTNPTLGTIQAKNRGPSSSGKSYRVCIGSPDTFEAELEVPNTVQALNAETVLLGVEILRQRDDRTLVLFKDAVTDGWNQRPRGLDGRISWITGEGPAWVPNELVSVQSDESTRELLCEQLFSLIRKNGTYSEEVRSFVQAHLDVNGFEDMALMLMAAVEASKKT